MKFIFGIHNHQPVGNFDHVMEDSYQRAYLPFLDLVETFPFLRFSLHVSGPLIEWLENHHSGYFDRIVKLVQSGNVEILSSGFYEPILASISDDDKIGQIRMMNDYIFQRFGTYPEGLWLTERVWEPGLVKPISMAGIKYIAVDDTHFSTSGKPIDQLDGYYLTEDQGYVLGVFPISQQLRYTIPFQAPEETINVFKKRSGTEDTVLVMADDGEKFGVWPGTFDHCFGENKWLKSFLTLLEKNQELVQTDTFSNVFHTFPPRGRVYLPTSSYFEMGEWTLTPELSQKFDIALQKLSNTPGEELKPFVKGGFWRNFLTKYDESNWMLKRVNHTSEVMNGNKNNLRHSIWRAQCNCAYWHGVFGGLYLPHLRHAIFENLINAEKQMTFTPIETVDIDHDGVEEIILTSKDLRLFCTPVGGAIRELDFLPANFNLMNTLSRYEEHYHSKLKVQPSNNGAKDTVSIHDIVKSKEAGLEKLLFYDSEPRWSFLDKFLPSNATIHELISGLTKDEGTFVGKKNTLEINGTTVQFLNAGSISGNPATIQKQISLDEDGMHAQVEIENIGSELIHSRYACEFNFSLLGGHTPDRYYLIDRKKPEHPEMDSVGIESCKEISLTTEWEKLKCSLKFHDETEIWRYPVETVNMSEGGFERVYQCSCVLPVWHIELRPGEKFTRQFTISVKSVIDKN